LRIVGIDRSYKRKPFEGSVDAWEVTLDAAPYGELDLIGGE